MLHVFLQRHLYEIAPAIVNNIKIRAQQKFLHSLATPLLCENLVINFFKIWYTTLGICYCKTLYKCRFFTLEAGDQGSLIYLFGVLRRFQHIV